MVVLIGRSNVGKSTLFNCLVEEHRAITSPEPGTTRDRNIAYCLWRGRNFELVDTGGIDAPSAELEKDILAQVKAAVAKANLALVILDARVGLLPADRMALKLLQRSRLPYVCVWNKADNDELRKRVLGMSLPTKSPAFAISAHTGTGTGDLLDAVVKLLPTGKASLPTPELRLSLIGKPNVGKSSLLNTLLGEERVIVHSTAHTTREPQSSFLRHHGTLLEIVDTAGIRRKARVAGDEQGGGVIEKVSVGKSIDSLRKSDVTLFVMDIAAKQTKQDQVLGSLIAEAGCGVIIVANKWDLIEKDTHSLTKFTEYVRQVYPNLYWAPIVFVSATHKTRVHDLLDMALAVAKERTKVIPQEKLDEYLAQTVRKKLPSRGKGTMQPKVYSIIQQKSGPPEFELLMNDPAILHFSYPRFVERELRRHFGFTGVPIQINLKKSMKKERKTGGE